MDIEKLKIRDIEEYLARNPEKTREIYAALLADSRIGVVALARKIEDRHVKDQREKERIGRMLQFERKFWSEGYHLIAGVDEAGKGPLAGPVVAAAVVFPRDVYIEGIDDSKKLSEKKRQKLYTQIRQRATATAVAVVDQAEIDRVNIYQAGLKAFSLAFLALEVTPDFVLSDAYKVPGVRCPQQPLVKGDTKSLTIAAASILAKVTRDSIMSRLHSQYPQYGFSQNKGYPTREHRLALREHGPCPCHRRSFDLLGQEGQGENG